MTFGDDTPEDAWHPLDPPGVLLDNLERRADALRRRPQAWPPDAFEALALLADLVHVLRRRHLSPPDRLRLALLDEDITYVRDLLAA